MASRSHRFPVSSDKRFKQRAGNGDTGTPERWQHSGRVLLATERPGVLAAKATEEHILDVLGMKRLLNERQIEAGLKFKADYHAAAIAAHTTGSYTGRTSTKDLFRSGHDRTEAQEAAYARWRKAIHELGLHTSAAVIDVVCHDAAPMLQDLAMLQDGLQKLAAWYKIQTLQGQGNR